MPFPASEIFAWLERGLMPLVYANTQFVAVSNDTRAEMESYNMSALPVQVVYNGVDASLVAGEKSPTPTVLYFGRLKAYKRVDLLIEAFSRVLRAVPHAVLRIAGAGDAEPGLRDAAARYGIVERVIFEGYVSEQRKRELLQQAWVLANPSSMEGWGISVIEANACATPAVAFRVPGLREAIRDGETGLLADEDGDLAAPITAILTDAGVRERLGRNALAHAQTLSWRASAECFYDIMLRTIAGDSYSIVRTNGHWVVVRGCNVLDDLPATPLTPILAGQRAE
jgi:glycosyltransferase involved in cell wall biosynthesis